jgi:Protein of unknown function (DUF2909)
MVKLAILLFLGFIVYNLGMGCYYMLNDKGKTDRVVRSLSWRVGLSVLLFAGILLGIKVGLIKPHGLFDRPGTESEVVETP